MCYCGLPTKAKNLCARHYLAEYRKLKNNGQIKTKYNLQQLRMFADLGYGREFCGAPDCSLSVKAKGLCQKHYLGLRRAETRAN